MTASTTPTVTSFAVEERERPTIMDGRVYTYSTSFRQEPGVFGPRDVAEGSFEVSASRNAVMVHRATITDVRDAAALALAIDMATKRMVALRGER